MTDNNGTRPLTLSVVGTGYLGATHAACMAELGFNVIATDVDPRKIAMLSTGVAPFFEPGLNELLQAHVRSGRLRFTSDIAEIAAECDVHFICVGTPQCPNGVADTSFLEAAFTALVTNIRRDALIVGKSTVPVGTAERLLQQLPSADATGVDIDLAWNPEFLREGFAVSDSLAPDRLVFGVHSAAAGHMLRRVYDKIIRTGVPVLTTDLASAQIIKMAANAFLASKISFINAMAEVCEAAAADVLDVATALGLDQRIGAAFLRPGLGFGGGCLPKDIRAFQRRATELGVGDAVSFLDQVDEINKRCRDHVVNAAGAMLGSSGDAVVTALGAAFKPQSDDIRDSPALDVAARLRALGPEVRVYDPAAMHNARMMRPELTYCSNLEDAVDGSDLLVFLTEWDEFRAIDPRMLARRVRTPQALDARHMLDGSRWTSAGWTYRAIGRTRPVEMVDAAPVLTVAGGQRNAAIA